MMISHDNSIIDNLDVDGGEAKIEEEEQEGVDSDGHRNYVSNDNNKSPGKSMRDSGEYNTILSANNKHEEFKLSLHGSMQDHFSGR